MDAAAIPQKTRPQFRKNGLRGSGACMKVAPPFSRCSPTGRPRRWFCCRGDFDAGSGFTAGSACLFCKAPRGTGPKKRPTPAAGSTAARCSTAHNRQKKGSLSASLFHIFLFSYFSLSAALNTASRRDPAARPRPGTVEGCAPWGFSKKRRSPLLPRSFSVQPKRVRPVFSGCPAPAGRRGSPPPAPRRRTRRPASRRSSR